MITIRPSQIKTTNDPTDTYVLAYDLATQKFTWADSTAVLTNVAYINVTNAFTAAQTIQAADLVYNAPLLTINKTYTGILANQPYMALFENTSEIAGGNDYQNEAHIALQAGSSANHRRYIRFNNYDGTSQFRTGVNASGYYILYDDESGVHRVWMQTDSGDGNTYLNAVGTGAVIIGAYSTDPTGTGGLQIWSGSAAPAKVHEFTPTSAWISTTLGVGIAAPTDAGAYVYYSSVSATSGITGLRSRLNIEPDSAPAANAVDYGQDLQVYLSGATTVTNLTLYGTRNLAVNNNTATTTNGLGKLYGGNFSFQHNSTGRTQEAGALRLTGDVRGGGSTPIVEMLRIDNPTVSGGATVTSAYGIYINSITAGGTNNYAIYTNSGHVRFNGGGDAATDFAVESDNYDALFIDASNDSIMVMSNTAGKIGFYGVTAVAQQVLATGASHTVDDVIAFLQTVGLCKQA